MTNLIIKGMVFTCINNGANYVMCQYPIAHVVIQEAVAF